MSQPSYLRDNDPSEITSCLQSIGAEWKSRQEKGKGPIDDGDLICVTMRHLCILLLPNSTLGCIPPQENQTDWVTTCVRADFPTLLTHMLTDPELLKHTSVSQMGSSLALPSDTYVSVGVVGRHPHMLCWMSCCPRGSRDHVPGARITSPAGASPDNHVQRYGVSL